MKALLLQEYNHLIYTDVPDPEICDPDDVIVAVKACGICGSDVAGFRGRTGRRIPPAIMGHECTGVVARKGSAVTDYEIGDRVVISASQFCGKCDMCLSGRTNMCRHHKVLGISCKDYKLQGAYAEYVRVPAQTIFHLPDHVSMTEGALLEPLANAVHAAVSLSREAIKTPVVVYGCGTIGLMVVQVLRAYNCPRIIVVDQVPEKLDIARSLGAHLTINSAETEAVAKVHELTDGLGVNLCIECVGIEATVRNALACVRTGGYLSVVGLLDPEIRLPMQNIVTGEVTVRGNFVYTADDFHESMRLLEENKIDTGILISDVMRLEDGPEAFERLTSGKEILVKIILTTT